MDTMHNLSQLDQDHALARDCYIALLRRYGQRVVDGRPAPSCLVGRVLKGLRPYLLEQREQELFDAMDAWFTNYLIGLRTPRR